MAPVLGARAVLLAAAWVLSSSAASALSPSVDANAAARNDPAITRALRSASAAPAGSSLLEVSARTGGIPMLSPEKCATIANAPPQEPILEKERCSLCEIIVENSRKWNWVGHYSSMCEGVPPHALEWCDYYSFKIAECGFPVEHVQGDQLCRPEAGRYDEPVPGKYLCSYCLQIPHTQVFGCFDDHGIINHTRDECVDL